MSLVTCTVGGVLDLRLGCITRWLANVAVTVQIGASSPFDNPAGCLREPQCESRTGNGELDVADNDNFGDVVE